MEAKPLIVIVGPTASGKTALAIDIARQFGGEIICADSRTVYKGMDIGTAKPTKAEQSQVRHWGLDLVEPNQKFSVADFKEYALRKIEEIRARGNIPFLVGGSGLYVDAVIFDYQFGPKADEERRRELEKMSLDELHEYCKKHNISLPENHKNKRYVIRAIEQKNINNKRRINPIQNCNIVGIATEPSVLKERIKRRAEQIFKDEVIDEAKKLGNMYGWDHESMTGNIYPLCKKYLNGEMTLDEVKQKFITLDWRLAKRQLTWFKRNEHIKWLDLGSAKEYLQSILETEQ